MPLVRPFETSFGRTFERRILLVEVEDADGAAGWGEVTCGERPFYNEEWVDSAWLVLRDFAIPRVLGREIPAAAAVGALNAAVRGHRMALGGLEAACWELEARKRGLPLWQHVGGERREIACGVSIGIQDSVGELLDLIGTEVEAGYRRVKIKIKPGWDVSVIRAVRARFPDIQLIADANSAYALHDAPRLAELDAFGLMMLEQPLGHDELVDHAEAIRVHDVCRDAGVPVWCGGMLESGIGRAHNIALSTLANFALPGDVSASKRYWARDIIDPPVTVTSRGTISAPDAPGLGYGLDLDRIEALSERFEESSRP